MNLPGRLKWLFAFLFLACGVPMLLVGGGSRSAGPHWLAGVTTVFLGAFAVCLAWEAWVTGRLNLQHFKYSRAGQPRRFTAAVALVLAGGCGTLAAGAWFLFFK